MSNSLTINHPALSSLSTAPWGIDNHKKKLQQNAFKPTTLTQDMFEPKNNQPDKLSTQHPNHPKTNSQRPKPNLPSLKFARAAKPSVQLEKESRDLLDAIRNGEWATVRLSVQEGIVASDAPHEVHNSEGGILTRANDRLLLGPYLVEEVINGHWDNVRSLIKAGADVNQLSESGHNPLFMAISRGYDNISNELIEAGANVNQDDGTGKNSLHWTHLTADQGNWIVRKLIAAGADVNKKEKYDGLTPLHMAAGYNRAENIHILIAAGARKNEIDNDGNTPLHLAVAFGNLEAVQALIQEGVEPNKLSKRGFTPGMLAATVAAKDPTPRKMQILEILNNASLAAL